MPLEDIGVVTVVAGTIVMALAVDTESFLREDLKSLVRELKGKGLMVPARTMVRKWPYWAGLFLIGAGTAMRWTF